MFTGGATPIPDPVLPDWRPAEGTFANVGLNTLASVKPTGWPSAETAGPFSNWSSAVLATDFGDEGAYVVHGSGHLTPGTAVWAGVWAWDRATRLWVGRNIPSAPLLESMETDYNEYGESIVTGTEGHTYPPHTYTGLAYMSAANGGGTNGSLLRFFFPGAGINNAVHKFDLSSASGAPTRVIDNLAMGGASSSYPATAVDEARGGVWVLPYNGAAPLKFVSFADWSATEYASVGYSNYGDNALIYVPTRDCLVGLGRANMDNTDFKVFVCPIVGGVPQGFTEVTTSGTPPSDPRSGGVWSTILECIVSYEAGGSTTVHRLTPPADLTGDVWPWTSETLTGVGGATPSAHGVVGGGGAYSRFKEDPDARCFLWCDSIDDEMQAWTLTGMDP